MKKGLPSHIQKALRAAALLAVPGRQEPLKKKSFSEAEGKEVEQCRIYVLFSLFCQQK
jgi:hypothetical protein